jgi:hypothetical protein
MPAAKAGPGSHQEKCGSDTMATEPNACLRCGAELQSIGTELVRVGGSTGGWNDVLACISRRKVEIRIPSNP